MVPAKGVERWLTQRLSHRLGAGPRGGDGVCAGVGSSARARWSRCSPARDRDDPWDPDRLVWPLLDVDRREPRRAVVRHPRRPPRPRPRRRRGRAAPRPPLLRRPPARRPLRVVRRAAAGAGRPTGATGRDTDGAGGPLDADLRWQAELWRRLVAAVDAPPPDVRHARDRRRGSAPAAPSSRCRRRLSLFGHTRLPVTEVELLRGARRGARGPPLAAAAVARRCGTTLARDRRGGSGARGRDDHSAELVGHPLLASLGRDTRELQRALRRPSVARRPTTEPPTRATSPTPCSAGSSTTSAPTHAPTPRTGRPAAPRPTTGRVQVHACHGAARQVEVLREVLVGLLAGRPDARAARHPRDVPRHRDLRAADLRRLRARRRRSMTARRPPGPPAAGPARRPRPDQHQPAARRRRRPWSSSPAAGRPPARCSTWPAPTPVRAPVRVHRRRPRPVDRLGRRRPGSAGGSTPSTARDVRDGRLRPEHLAVRPRPDPARRRRWPSDDHRHVGRGLPLDDVGERRHRPGRPARRAASTGSRAVVDRAGRRRPVERVARRAAATASRALDRRRRRPTPGSWPSSSASSRRVARASAATTAGVPLRLADVRALLESAARRPADPRQLPHRHPHRLHDGADALGAAPRRLPGRPRRRGVPARPRRSTATTCSPATR